MRRSCVSIPSNIAEGFDRNSKKEYLYFLSIANGSKAEIETQLMICVRQNFLTDAQTEKAISLCKEIGKMLNSIIKNYWLLATNDECILPPKATSGMNIDSLRRALPLGGRNETGRKA